ncbi:MAG: hypothetical protein JWR51_2757 [Devosia sp.]|nr:hypothetical protein [Devosia sp.]
MRAFFYGHPPASVAVAVIVIGRVGRGISKSDHGFAFPSFVHQHRNLLECVWRKAVIQLLKPFQQTVRMEFDLEMGIIRITKCYQ